MDEKRRKKTPGEERDTLRPEVDIKHSGEDINEQKDTLRPEMPIGRAREASDEEGYAIQLEAEQERYQNEQQLIDAYNEGLQYEHPSYIKYGIVGALGLLTESADFLDLIGFGIAISKPMSLVISVIIFFIFWITNTKQKKAQDYTKNIGELIESVQQNLAHLERRTYQVARIARRFGANRLAARIRIAPRLIKRNPLLKFAGLAAVNLVPLVAVFPWVLLGIYLSYRDEKSTLRNARESALEIREQIPELESA